MANYHRHANAVPVAALSRWVIVAFFLCASGLSYVYFKNQLHAAGDEIRNLERQLADLRMQNEAVNTQISRLSSYEALKKRRAEGFIKMIAISDDKIVHLTATAAGRGSDLQPVANREIVK